MGNKCPYCHNLDFTKSYLPSTSFNNRIFDYLKCRKCAIIFINPQPNEDDYIKMYPPEYQGKVFSGDSDRFSQLFKKIKTINKNVTTVLDYGCGSGELLINATHFFPNLYGVEYNEKYISELSNTLTKIAFCNIEKFKEIDAHFDVIFVNNVLEHLTNPNEILTELRNKLKPSGLLVCLGPIENNFTLAQNFRKLFFRLRNVFSKKPVNHVPYHISFSNYKNQLMIFENNKFEKISFEIEEVSWPYPSKITFSSIKLCMYSLIAAFSKIFSKKISSKAGNTFLYIGKKYD